MLTALVKTDVNTPTTNVMKKYVLTEQVTKAEILWALETVSSHNSYRSAGSNTGLFKVMFPDS